MQKVHFVFPNGDVSFVNSPATAMAVFLLSPSGTLYGTVIEDAYAEDHEQHFDCMVRMEEVPGYRAIDSDTFNRYAKNMMRRRERREAERKVKTAASGVAYGLGARLHLPNGHHTDLPSLCQTIDPQYEEYLEHHGM